MHDVLKFRSSGYFFTLFLFVLFASILITPASAESVVSISPSEQSIATGSNVTVVVYIEPDTPISGAQFDLSFDSDLLSVVSISEGDVFTNGASTIFNAGTIDNSEGTIMNVFNYPLGKIEVMESGTLATIVFDTKGSGTSSLLLSNVVVSNSSAVAVPISVVNGMVSIIGESAPSDGEMSNSGSGGGGSSGGSGATGEDFGNIEFKDVAEKNVRSVRLSHMISILPETPL